MNTQPTLQTKRLRLRPFLPSDASDVQLMAGDSQVAKMTENIPHPYSDGMAEEWISTHQQDWNARANVTWAVCSSTGANLLGCVGLAVNDLHCRASLGYWIGKNYWGNGFCTEAAKAVVEFGFENLNLRRIEALHLSVNPASGAVMRKIGMSHEGTMRSYVLKDGVFEDMERYAILVR